MFHKLHLGPFRPVTFSLQLEDGSKMQPLGKLKDVPVKTGDIWVLEEFVSADVTESDDAQIILAMFCFIDEKVVRPNSSLSDALSLSPEINMEDGLDCQDPYNFD